MCSAPEPVLSVSAVTSWRKRRPLTALGHFLPFHRCPVVLSVLYGILPTSIWDLVEGMYCVPYVTSSSPCGFLL